MRKILPMLLILAGCTSTVTTTPETIPVPTPVVTEPTPVTEPAPVATLPSPTQPPAQESLPLSWESPDKPERAEWSKIIIREMDAHSAKFSKANDVADFCPKFSTLSQSNQKRALAEIVVGVIYYETGYDPNSRMVETTMGKDCITGNQIASEGLLQLSYCDKTWANNCAFDWSKDKVMPPNDPKKTILNPEINLVCGIGIMANQVDKKGSFAFDKSNYWAVLRPNGRYGKVDGIKARMKKNAAYCH